MAALTLIVLPVFTAGFVAGRTPGRAVTEPGKRSPRMLAWGSIAVTAKASPAATGSAAPGSVTATSRGLYRGRTAAQWAARYRHRTRQLQAARAVARRRWMPTVTYALRLASAVTGVPYGDLRTVAWCESTLNPYARNGRHKGVMQLGWAPFGLSPYDPVANVLSAALTVRRESSWRRWTCKP